MQIWGNNMFTYNIAAVSGNFPHKFQCWFIRLQLMFQITKKFQISCFYLIRRMLLHVVTFKIVILLYNNEIKYPDRKCIVLSAENNRKFPLTSAHTSDNALMQSLNINMSAVTSTYNRCSVLKYFQTVWLVGVSPPL